MGVPQGCVMVPLLFTIFMDWVIYKWEVEGVVGGGDG